MTGTFVPAVGAAKVVLTFAQVDGEYAQNSLWVHSQDDSAFTSDTLSELATAVNEWYQTGAGGHSYQSLQAAPVELVSVYCRAWDTDTSPVWNLTSGQTGGSDRPLSIPNGQTFAITARTGIPGVAYRGRTFVIGLFDQCVTDDDNNVIKSDIAADLANAWAGLIDMANGLSNPCDMVVNSSYHVVTPGEKAVPRDAAILTPITGYGYHDLFLDYQRRRAPGHNRHH
jgi:hypothetical protein